jgi:hypothetical protein
MICPHCGVQFFSTFAAASHSPAVCKLERDRRGGPVGFTSCSELAPMVARVDTMSAFRCEREKNHEGQHVATFGDLVVSWPMRDLS